MWCVLWYPCVTQTGLTVPPYPSDSPVRGCSPVYMLDFQEPYLMTRLAVKSNGPHGNGEKRNLPKSAHTEKW